MTTTLSMLETYPHSVAVDRRQLAATIDTLLECSQVCTACADACLDDMTADVITSVRTNQDCSDICDLTAHMLSRVSGADAVLSRGMLELAIAACDLCAAECSKHADMHAHCRICAEVCARSARICRDLLAMAH